MRTTVLCGESRSLGLGKETVYLRHEFLCGLDALLRLEYGEESVDPKERECGDGVGHGSILLFNRGFQNF